MNTFRIGLCAAGVALASGTAHAQTFNLQVYGTLLPYLDSAGTSGATESAPADKPNQLAGAAYTGINQKQRRRITTGTSNFGFKGGYDFGDGFGATFQIESAVPLDNDTSGAPAGNIANRDSYIGLTNADWGTLVIGSLDTPYKAATLAVAVVRGINPFEYDVILENPGFNVPGTTTAARPNVGPPGSNAAFSRRQGNSLQYWTKKFNVPLGTVKGSFGWSVDEGAVRIDSGNTTHPQIFSMSAEYDLGFVMARYAYERHEDYFGMAVLGGSPGVTVANPSSVDTGHKLFVRWQKPEWGTKVQGVFERLQYATDDSAAGAVNEYRRDAAYLTASQNFLEKHNAWLSYGRALPGDCELVNGGDCSTNGLGAWMASAGYIYNWTASIDLYGSLYHVDNQESAQYGPVPMASSTFTTAPGADTTAVGVGILVRFATELL